MARQAEMEAGGARVLLVSFGVREGAQRWLQEEACPYPMLLDSKRQLYHSFGLYRSVSKVWSVKCLVYFAEEMAHGTKLPAPYENIHDDTQQMGGDFILDREGRVHLLYPSQASTDRPTVDMLLSSLQELQTR